MIKYGSVCSGIEAATAAWHSLGWKPAWFSEIESFPCKVLKHHYPEVPNLGDMTKLNEHKIYNDESIDLLVGGTPCQSFSIAGLRGGMDDERGNLALEYCRILIAKQPKWFVWENVPGVFSSNSGKDFACLLSAFTGKEINPEGLGNAGVIEGNVGGYSVAWRVLDAQYFGVPQRRRRVFVVGHLGNDWRPPYAVLFERDSLRRDFEKSAKERKGIAGKVERNTSNSISSDLIETYSYQNNHTGIIESQVSATLKKEGSTTDERSVGAYVAFGAQNSHHQTMNVSETVPTLDKSKVPAICIQGSMIGRDDKNSPQGDGVNEDVAFTLNRTDRHGVCYSIQTGQTGANGSNISENISPVLTKGDKHAVVYENHGQDSRVTEMNVCPSITKKWGTGGNNVPLVEAFQQNGDGELRTGEVCFTLNKNSNASGRNAPLLAQAIARRLTPLECERLQGFPDFFTAIPGAKDSPRYAAIGNSMAVPVMHWIGKRIDMMDKFLTSIKTENK